MKKISYLFLIILLFATILLELDISADAKSNSSLNFLERVKNTARKSIRSIQHFSLLSVAKGTLTLITKGKVSKSLKSIYLGNDSIIPHSKKIKVSGVNDGSNIRLEGKGKTGKGYFFSIQTPAKANKYSRSKKTFRTTNPLKAQLSFSKNRNKTEVNLNVNARGVRIKNKSTITGKFTKKVGNQGIAKGRFILKLSAVSRNNRLPSISTNEGSSNGPCVYPDGPGFNYMNLPVCPDATFSGPSPGGFGGPSGGFSSPSSTSSSGSSSFGGFPPPPTPSEFTPSTGGFTTPSTTGFTGTATIDFQKTLIYLKGPNYSEDNIVIYYIVEPANTCLIIKDANDNEIQSPLSLGDCYHTYNPAYSAATLGFYLKDMTPPIAIGTQIKICNKNNPSNCSNLVTAVAG